MLMYDLCFIRCEQQLSASLERQKNLEVMRLQVELEWQKRCENMKTEHYHVNEQLIKDLIRHRDQVRLCVFFTFQ